MLKCVALLAALFAGCFAMAESGVDESHPYGRVCITVIGPGEGHEEAYRPTLHPGPGERISIVADSNRPCQMLVAAFHPVTGRIVNQWAPEMVELAEWEEKRLPKAPTVWNWPAGSEPFEIYVLFVDSTSPDVKDLQALLGVMVKSNGPLLIRQAVKLRELITRSIVEPEKARQVLPSRRAEIGGTLRGGPFGGAPFKWRQFASRVNFNPTQPGLLILPGSVAEDSGAANGSSAK